MKWKLLWQVARQQPTVAPDCPQRSQRRWRPRETALCTCRRALFSSYTSADHRQQLIWAHSFWPKYRSRPASLGAESPYCWHKAHCLRSSFLVDSFEYRGRLCDAPGCCVVTEGSRGSVFPICGPLHSLAWYVLSSHCA